jgi:hypothetical protein
METKVDWIAKGYQLRDGDLRPADVLVGFGTASLTSSLLREHSLDELAAAPPFTWAFATKSPCGSRASMHGMRPMCASMIAGRRISTLARPVVSSH